MNKLELVNEMNMKVNNNMLCRLVNEMKMDTLINNEKNKIMTELNMSSTSERRIDTLMTRLDFLIQKTRESQASLKEYINLLDRHTH